MTTLMIPWSAKVSDVFIDRVFWMVNDLDMGHGPEDGVQKVMGIIAWENDREFKADVINKAGSGATGLIQFMPDTAEKLGTTTSRLARMSAEDQLNYVWKYFAQFGHGKLKTLGDMYAAVLWPKGIGKPEDFVYWDAKTRPTTYRQNSGLDKNKDKVITKAEATKKVTERFDEGFKPSNMRPYTPLAEREAVVAEPVLNATSDEELALELADRIPPPTNPHLDRLEAAFDAFDMATKPNEPILKKVSKAAAGWQGNFLGVGTIITAVVSNPQFSSALGEFTTRLARGDGMWSALAIAVGAGLVAYGRKGQD